MILVGAKGDSHRGERARGPRDRDKMRSQEVEALQSREEGAIMLLVMNNELV